MRRRTRGSTDRFHDFHTISDQVSFLGRRMRTRDLLQACIQLFMASRLIGCSALSSRFSKNRRRNVSLRASESTSDIQTDRLRQVGRASFQSHFNFNLDDWQCHAGGAITDGFNLIVCAPTGAGKVISPCGILPTLYPCSQI